MRIFGMMKVAPLYLLLTAALSCLTYLSLRAQQIILSTNEQIYSLDTAGGSCSLAVLNAPTVCMSSPRLDYSSVALYRDTLYVLTTNELWRYILGDTSSCTPLLANVYTVAMTADSNGLVYWVGNDSNELIKYDPHLGQLSILGKLNYYPAGDLLFYERDLYMAAYGALIKINVQDPAQSEIYMATPGLGFYGLANPVGNCLNHSILGFAQTTGGTTTFEIDMEARTCRPLCLLPVYVLDAASSGENGGYGLSAFIFPTNDSIGCLTTLVLNAGYPGATYVWDNNSTSESRTVDMPGKYWVTVTDSGCVVSDTILYAPISPPVLSLPADTTICPAIPLLLNAGFPNCSYLWQDGSTAESDTVTQAGQYFVQATNQCGTAVDTTTVHMISLLAPWASTDTTLCTGDTLVLNAGNPGSSYTWEDNSTQPTHLIDQTGIYWITLSDSGCVLSDTINCTFVSPPSIHLPKDTLLCSSDSLTLDASFLNTSYLWQDGSNGPTLTVIRAGLYSVRATNGCATVTDSARVQFEDCSCTFYVPNAFTPGNGGINGIFLPKYRCTLNLAVEKYQLDIYDRWGQRIFHSTDLNQGWDGAYHGQPQPSGTFVWELVYQDTQAAEYIHKKGIVLLIR